MHQISHCPHTYNIFGLRWRARSHLRHGLSRPPQLQFLLHSKIEERCLASSNVVKTSDEHHLFEAMTPSTRSDLCSCSACWPQLCEGNLLARMLAPVAPTALLQLSMIVAFLETLPKRSWRISPASNFRLFPHLQQLWGVMARALPFATWVV